MLLRLAGMGGKALFGLGAKKGAGAAIGRFGREALADAALVGGITQIPNAIGLGYGMATGDLKKDTEREIINRGKDEDGYQINLGDRVKGFLTGGIDDKSLDTRKGSMNLAELNDPKNAARKQALKNAGVNVSADGRGRESIDALEAEFADDILESQLKKKAGIERGLRISDPDYISPKAELAKAEARARIAYDDNQTQLKLAREDSLSRDRNNLTQALAQMEFEKSKANRQFDYDDRVLEYNMKAKKAERMQQIAMALGALPGLFGI